MVQARFGASRRRTVGVAAIALALAAACLGILTIRTPDGVLVFEGLPQGADVTVDGSTVSVRWSENQQQATCVIRPGSYQVEVHFNDVKLEGERVSISAGEETVLIVRAAPPPKFSEPSSATFTSTDPLIKAPVEVPRNFPLRFEELGTIYFRDTSNDPAFPLAYSPHGDIFAIGDRNTVRIWEIGARGDTMDSWKERFTWRSNSRSTDVVLSACFSRDGQTVVLGTERGDVYGILPGSSVNNVTLNLQTNRPAVNSVALSGDGQWLATGHANGEYALWNAATSELIQGGKQQTPNAAFPQIHSLDFSEDGELLAIGGPRLELREVTTWRQRWECRVHTWSHFSARFTKDGKYLFTTGKSGEPYHYAMVDVANGVPSRMGEEGLVGAESLSLIDHDRFVVTGDSSGVLRIWDRSDGKLSAPLLAKHRLSAELSVGALEFNHNRQHVLAGSDPGSVTVLRIVQADAAADERAAPTVVQPKEDEKASAKQKN